MKLLIITLFAFAGLCLAADGPQKSVINPDFLFLHTAEYHTLATALQEEINESVIEVITTVSNVLKSSTRETLTSYEEHFGTIVETYKPLNNDLATVQDDYCRSYAQTILNSIVSFTEFSSSNCANTYDGSVKTSVNKANNAITSLDDRFGQVQLIVTRNFIRQNAFLSPEDIKYQITTVYEDVKTKWLAAKPEMEGIRTLLTSEIGALNQKLDGCHEGIQDSVVDKKPDFAEAVAICLEYEKTELPFGRSKNAQKSSIDEKMEKLLERVQSKIANTKPYEW